MNLLQRNNRIVNKISTYKNMALSYNYCRQTKYITRTQSYVIRSYLLLSIA